MYRRGTGGSGDSGEWPFCPPCPPALVDGSGGSPCGPLCLSAAFPADALEPQSEVNNPTLSWCGKSSCGVSRSRGLESPLFVSSPACSGT